MSARVRLTALGLLACALAAAVGVALAERGEEAPAPLELGPTGLAGSVRPPGARVPEFALRDQDGRVVRSGDLRGRPVIYTFIYSTCEDTCPLQVQQIRGALDDLGSDVPVVGVSVDPAGDTAERAKRFVLEQRMTGRMRFLLGSRAQLAPVWRAFGIAPQRGELDHSAYVVLADASGAQRVGFPVGQLTPRGLAHDVAKLL